MGTATKKSGELTVELTLAQTKGPANPPGAASGALGDTGVGSFAGEAGYWDRDKEPPAGLVGFLSASHQAQCGTLLSACAAQQSWKRPSSKCLPYFCGLGL